MPGAPTTERQSKLSDINVLLVLELSVVAQFQSRLSRMKNSHPPVSQTWESMPRTNWEKSPRFAHVRFGMTFASWLADDAAIVGEAISIVAAHLIQNCFFAARRRV
jgi:hypothetical protein